MAKRKKKTKYRYVTRVRRSFRRRDKRVPILTTIPVLNTMAIQPILGDNVRLGAKKIYDSTQNIGDAALEAMNIISLNFSGFSIKGPDAGKWYASFPTQTYLQIIAGAMASKFLGKYVNPQIKKVPYLGKYIKL